jgi:hypothetical protein
VRLEERGDRAGILTVRDQMRLIHTIRQLAADVDGIGDPQHALEWAVRTGLVKAGPARGQVVVTAKGGAILATYLMGEKEARDEATRLYTDGRVIGTTRCGCKLDVPEEAFERKADAGLCECGTRWYVTVVQQENVPACLWETLP